MPMLLTMMSSSSLDQQQQQQQQLPPLQLRTSNTTTTATATTTLHSRPRPFYTPECHEEVLQHIYGNNLNYNDDDGNYNDNNGNGNYDNDNGKSTSVAVDENENENNENAGNGTSSSSTIIRQPQPKVLLFITTHFSNEHVKFFDCCWPLLMSKSKFLQKANVMIAATNYTPLTNLFHNDEDEQQQQDEDKDQKKISSPKDVPLLPNIQQQPTSFQDHLETTLFHNNPSFEIKWINPNNYPSPKFRRTKTTTTTNQKTTTTTSSSDSSSTTTTTTTKKRRRRKYNGSVNDKQWGANLALMVAFQNGWFTSGTSSSGGGVSSSSSNNLNNNFNSNNYNGYDWVIRINPDVLIRNSTFLQQTFVDPQIDAILHKCRMPSCSQSKDNPEHSEQSFKYLQIHTDILVFRPNAPLLWGTSNSNNSNRGGDGKKGVKGQKQQQKQETRWKQEPNDVVNEEEDDGDDIDDDIDVDVPFTNMEPSIGELFGDDEYGKEGLNGWGTKSILKKAAEGILWNATVMTTAAAAAAANNRSYNKDSAATIETSTSTTTTGTNINNNNITNNKYLTYVEYQQMIDDINYEHLNVEFNHELTASKYFHSIVLNKRHRWWDGIPDSFGLCRVGHTEKQQQHVHTDDGEDQQPKPERRRRTRTSPVIHDHDAIRQCRIGYNHSSPVESYCSVLDGYDIV